jgi:hypothetical protein
MPSSSIRSPRCPIPAFLDQLQRHFAYPTSATYTMGMPLSPIRHPLSTLNLSITAAAPQRPVHLLPSVNMRGMPYSLALSYVVLAASRSSEHTPDGADCGTWINSCRFSYPPGSTASREIYRHPPFFHTCASIGVHTPSDRSAVF